MSRRFAEGLLVLVMAVTSIPTAMLGRVRRSAKGTGRSHGGV